MIPEKITFRLGHLAGPLSEWCAENNQTPSEAARTAIAQLLHLDPPAMPVGNPHAAEQAKAANAARWPNNLAVSMADSTQDVV